MNKDSTLFHDAEIIDQHMRNIRRVLLQAYDADKNRSHLTAPQMQAMAILVQPSSEGQDGMTIRGLCERMRLAQSTVSSLVNRLERKKLVTRQPDPSDNRYTRIVLTENVKSYLAQDVLDKRLIPLVSALQRASLEERKTIMDGFTVLSRLLIDSLQSPDQLPYPS